MILKYGAFACAAFVCHRDLTDLEVKEPKKGDKAEKPAEVVRSAPDGKREPSDTEAMPAAEEKK